MHWTQSLIKRFALASSVFGFSLVFMFGPDIYLPFISNQPGPVINPTAPATSTATNTPVPATATATPTATSTPTLTPTATVVPGPCECTSDLYNCSDFDTQPEAQACFDYCLDITGRDIHRLDQNNNNVACESLPGQRITW